MSKEISIEVSSDAKNFLVEADTERLGDIRIFGALELRYKLRRYFAEFFGMMILVIFGDGIIATVTLDDFGQIGFIMIAFGWCFGLAMALYISMGVSGGHLNPAVTIAMALFKKMPMSHVPGYLISQFFGAFAGAAIVYGNFSAKFDSFDGGVRQTTGKYATAGIFATYPDPENTVVGCFFTEMLLTGLMLFILGGIFDKHLTPARGFEPLAVGFMLFVLIISTGAMTGSPMNPFRDLAPRIFTSIAGWGSAPFTAYNYHFWIPIVAPTIGAILGIGLYEFFIIPNVRP
ncbi:hypothetical protein BB560_000669 [Smittium megazygosporum]|uniref:Uncharacterized protein n=1 Tax=Smittium megazygosporum TaxID=133381 RepID=A0A2T9ZJU3_9FUNG|nr:hypothetical protein BB560_004680 [Smittium megazygosporum]PVV02795.1 hypothetical protein BB560_002735 [Smittium megazygosporum]PVV04820.1 hypothetical protein BB560_000669 [Smittium megazygosporum]